MTRPKTLLRLATLATAASLLLGGCAAGGNGVGDKGGDGGDGADGAADANSLAAIQASGELIIGTEGTYKPFSFHADGTGDLTGYDVEIITAVADKLGVTPKFEETQWDAIFAGLEAGRFAVIANQVSINDERSAKYEFSAPYTVSPGVIVVQRGATGISSFADLKGKTTAQSLTSNWYTLAKDNGANVEAVEGWAQAVALLEQKRVDATVNDELTVLDYQKQNPDNKLEIVAETDDPSLSAFAFAKGNIELRDAVDKALVDLRAAGTLAEISDKYFGKDVTE